MLNEYVLKNSLYCLPINEVLELNFQLGLLTVSVNTKPNQN